MDNAFGVSFVDPDFSFQRKKLKPDLLDQYAHGDACNHCNPSSKLYLWDMETSEAGGTGGR